MRLTHDQKVIASFLNLFHHRRWVEVKLTHEETGKSPASIRKIVASLVKKGLAETWDPERGSFRLTPEGRRAAKTLPCIEFPITYS